MIRPFRQQDMDALLEVWLLSSLQACDFISASFWWLHQEEAQKRYLHCAEIWVAEEQQEVVGFMALVGDYLVALFVRPNEQGRGVGKQMLEKAKGLRSRLVLRIFADNDVAVRFCQHQGFMISRELIDETTQRSELLMEYSPRSPDYQQAMC
ncbi:GNAT family N-acetyltransferase [Dongshaea marina]|uniref:GNAT family N-acetyltransferase n=1 Tax=Dongshaea marina TaxID=2047966 RepID=UPI000D3EBFF9|nr:GNAT family N-acetyltransferase [Dongshaea marina]